MSIEMNGKEIMTFTPKVI